jgi:Uma2 family endonuclease
MPVSTARSDAVPPVPPVDREGGIPPLRDGDRLTREEFDRRYDAMPHLKKAELIEGVVHLPSPVRQRQHGGPHSRLIGWLFTYEARTPGLELGDNSTVRLDVTNVPQPDCVLFIQPKHGGKVEIDQDGYINGAPDLVAEVAASSTSYDLNDKLRVFQAKGVRDYIVWRVLDRQVDWYVLRGDRYERLDAGDDGVLRSTIFPGLWLDPAALIRKHSETLLEALRRGLETPEHAAFKAELQRAGIDPGTAGVS